MSYAILRVAKIKTAQQAAVKTAHNYRQKPVPNAELDADRPNREYVNTAEIDYWHLAEARIAEAGAYKNTAHDRRAKTGPL